MLFERARWPENVNPEVADAPCCGVRSVLTPGVITAKEMKFLPSIGRLSICCCDTTLAIAVFCESTTGASAKTVMDSAVPAILSEKSASTSDPRLRVRSCRVALTKPGIVTSTRYVPGGSAGSAKRPSSWLVVDRATLVAVLVAVMLAPGSTAPD